MPSYLEFRVELHHARPAIWRRLLIRPDATFGELHDAIQAACGWKNCHLFCFYAKAIASNPIAGVPDEDYPGMPDAERVPLDAHFGSHQRCLYLYDFGDGWEHEVSLEGGRICPKCSHASSSLASERSRPRTAVASAGTRSAWR